MNKALFFIGLLLLIGMGVCAKGTIRGRVIDDSTNTALSDVTIAISGTSRGTTTALDGSFSLSLPTDGRKHSLLVSHAGYEQLTVPVGGADAPLNLRLKRVARALEDVVVTAACIGCEL